MIQKAIVCGTCKINVNTECQMAFSKILREVLANDQKVYDPRKIIGPASKAIENAVREKIAVFGTADKN